MSLTSPTEVDLSISSICPDEITAVATGGSGAYLYELFDRFGLKLIHQDLLHQGLSHLVQACLIGGFNTR